MRDLHGLLPILFILGIALGISALGYIVLWMFPAPTWEPSFKVLEIKSKERSILFDEPVSLAEALTALTDPPRGPVVIDRDLVGTTAGNDGRESSSVGVSHE